MTNGDVDLALAASGPGDLGGSGDLVLISHTLCPYVQRAVIALSEKGVAFKRIDVDLGNKPDWFRALSPLGKTPVLRVGSSAIFESAVILEYLEETQPRPLHPADPLLRAEHRGWIEVSSQILADIAGLYTAADEAGFRAKADQLRARFARVEARAVVAPWFDGPRFSLVDAAFGPVFRYFDVFDQIGAFAILDGNAKIESWRDQLSARPSVRSAVSPDYPRQLRDFLARRKSWLSTLIS